MLNWSGVGSGVSGKSKVVEFELDVDQTMEKLVFKIQKILRKKFIFATCRIILHGGLQLILVDSSTI